jgi:hypothetical protein
MRFRTSITDWVGIALLFIFIAALAGIVVGLLRGPDRLAEVSLAATAIPLVGWIVLSPRRVSGRGK